MPVFLTLIRLGLKRFFRYPWGLMISLITEPMLLFLNILVFTTLYHYNQRETILDYNLRQLLSYTAAASFIWFWTYNNADGRIASRIMRGDLTQDLLRPVSLFTWELGAAVSLRISGVIFEFIPALLIFSLMLGPEFLSLVALFRFMLAASLAFLLGFTINFLIGISTFYFQSIRALLGLRHIMVAFLAGAMIPLEFFPGSVQRMLHSLPFPYIFYWPIQFFLNRGAASSWDEFLFRAGIALLWIIVFLVLGNLLWRQAVRQYADVGG